jgi:hypothetical protein
VLQIGGKLMDHPNFESGDFKKSSFSQENGECVEVASRDGVLAVRHSKDRSGPVLYFNEDEWRAFLKGVRNNEFDF